MLHGQYEKNYSLLSPVILHDIHVSLLIMQPYDIEKSCQISPTMVGHHYISTDISNHIGSDGSPSAPLSIDWHPGNRRALSPRGDAWAMVITRPLGSFVVHDM